MKKLANVKIVTSTVNFVRKFAPTYQQKQHLLQAHFSRKVIYKEHEVLPFKLPHNSSQNKRAHYHCPLCNETVINRKPFQKHLQAKHEHTRPNKETNQNNENVEDNCSNPNPEKSIVPRNDCPRCSILWRPIKPRAIVVGNPSNK